MGLDFDCYWLLYTWNFLNLDAQLRLLIPSGFFNLFKGHINRQGEKMKTIGMIGGMSWESSIEYYRIINQTTREKLGGLHSAKSIMFSVEFAEIEALQHQNRWGEATRILVDAAQKLERAGADFVIICTNTMHKVYDDVQKRLRIPMLHIADATGGEIIANGIRRIGLLGTRFTMEEDFYKGRLIEKYKLEVIVPAPDEMEDVHRIIYDELCAGKIIESSKEKYAGIIRNLVNAGVEGIILGCTEIGLLIKAQDSPIPLFDTTEIHAKTAVAYALENYNHPPR